MKVTESSYNSGEYFWKTINYEDSFTVISFQWHAVEKTNWAHKKDEVMLKILVWNKLRPNYQYCLYSADL